MYLYSELKYSYHVTVCLLFVCFYTCPKITLTSSCNLPHITVNSCNFYQPQKVSRLLHTVSEGKPARLWPLDIISLFITGKAQLVLQ